MRYIACLAGLLISVSVLGQQTPDAAEPKTVTVTAEGYDRDDAIKRALRMALEQGAGVQIATYSEVENYALLRDTIYSRAAGIVKDYRVLEEKPGAGGTVIVTVKQKGAYYA